MSNKPIHTIRDGACKVSIWANLKSEGEGVWYEVTPGRTYTGATDQAKTANSFSNGDILKIAQLLEAAYRWIGQQKARDRHDAKREEMSAS